MLQYEAKILLDLDLAKPDLIVCGTSLIIYFLKMQGEGFAGQRPRPTSLPCLPTYAPPPERPLDSCKLKVWNRHSLQGMLIVSVLRKNSDPIGEVGDSG